MRKPRHLFVWIAAVIGLGVFFAYLAWAARESWALGGDSRMSIHGWVAMGLGVGLTALLGGGLMWLAFYSSRKGFDENVRPDDEA